MRPFYRRTTRHRPLAERYWEKVKVGGPDECWEWKAGKNKAGYGQIMVDHGDRKTMIQATRVAWLLEEGDWPKQDMLHTCDNPGCCNPAHLYEGDDLQNMADAKERGRIATGERHWAKVRPDLIPRGMRANKSGLTDDDVLAIRARYVRGSRTDGCGALAHEYGVVREAIRKIVNRKTWTHI